MVIRAVIVGFVGCGRSWSVSGGLARDRFLFDLRVVRVLEPRTERRAMLAPKALQVVVRLHVSLHESSIPEIDHAGEHTDGGPE